MSEDVSCERCAAALFDGEYHRVCVTYLNGVTRHWIDEVEHRPELPAEPKEGQDA